MSAYGTKRTSQDMCSLSAFGGKADTDRRLASTISVAIDPIGINGGLEIPQCSLPSDYFRWAAAATADQRAISLLMYSANLLGPPSSGSKPSLRSFSTASGACIVFCAALANLSITGRGVPTGAKRPNHRLVSKSGSPASVIVGTSGSALERLNTRAVAPRVTSCAVIQLAFRRACVSLRAQGRYDFATCRACSHR